MEDAELQLIMHTIDELTAGGAANAATLGPDRAPASLALRWDTPDNMILGCQAWRIWRSCRV